jgi:hypothetical protein
MATSARIHRMGLIACHYRAAEWRYKEIELAAHELLQLLDEASADADAPLRPPAEAVETSCTAPALRDERHHASCLSCGGDAGS